MIATRFPAKVPEYVVRVSAIQVFIIAGLALALRFPWLVMVLAADFAIRAFLTPRVSPLAAFSRLLSSVLPGAPGTLLFYTPKRFAATIGFALSAAALVFGAAGAWGGFYVSLGMLGVFSFLEGTFGFCAGCKIFSLLVRLGVIPKAYCPDCA